MKIVIDIPEDRFRDIKRIASVQLKGRFPTVQQIIANGAPLPKGHGRLIDAEYAEKRLKEVMDEDEEQQALARYVIRSPEETPTIIEADK